MTKEAVTRVKFVSTISKMGDRRIINIPSTFFKEVDKLEAKQVKIIIDDEI
ncbi:MAG TPA: hypothetical protein VJ772_06485 [Nitrososphaeraceae archaeon]|nr:hypothetical protein [Nitrososphaeraceae archaeon]